MKILVDTKASKISVRLAKAADLKTSLFKHLFPYYKKNPSLDEIDIELHSLITDMWEKGYKTLSCCSGHGEKTGYIIWRKPRGRRWMQVYWEPKTKIPQSLDDIVHKKEFAFKELTVDIRMSKRRLQRFIKLAKKSRVNGERRKSEAHTL